MALPVSPGCYVKTSRLSQMTRPGAELRDVRSRRYSVGAVVCSATSAAAESSTVTGSRPSRAVSLDETLSRLLQPSSVRRSLSPLPNRRSRSQSPSHSPAPRGINRQRRGRKQHHLQHVHARLPPSRLECFGCYCVRGPALLTKVGPHTVEAQLLPGAVVEIMNRDEVVTYTYQDLLSMSAAGTNSFDGKDYGVSGHGSYGQVEARCMLVGENLQLKGMFEKSSGTRTLVHGDMTVMRVGAMSDMDFVQLGINGCISHPVNVCPPQQLCASEGMHQ